MVQVISETRIKLFRVIRDHRYNGGAGCDQRQGSPEVLYCGYDREEAIRVYYANPSTGHCVPGHYYKWVQLQSKWV